MHNLYANFVKILEVCKHFAQDVVNNKGNLTRPGGVPKFSDLEVIALSLTAETMDIDSECYLFGKLEEYRKQMPNLISSRQYNNRRKLTAQLCEKIRKRIVEAIDGGEDYFIIDTKPVKVCQLARKRIETIFSQFDDQFNIMRNYAKDYIGFFKRIISKVSALTVSQYLNKINDRPIGRIKYALA